MPRARLAADAVVHMSPSLLFAECGRAAATITITMMLADGSIGTVKVLDFWHPMTSLLQALLLPRAGGQHGCYGHQTKPNEQGRCLQPSLISRGGAAKLLHACSFDRAY